jgi:hypothetical protein
MSTRTITRVRMINVYTGSERACVFHRLEFRTSMLSAAMSAASYSCCVPVNLLRVLYMCVLVCVCVCVSHSFARAGQLRAQLLLKPE